MGRRYEVVWAPLAEGDAETIVDFIAVDEPANAERLLARLEAAARTLERFPNRGRVVPEMAEIGATHGRELVVSPYRIIYVVGDERVEVVAVVDGRRNARTILAERLRLRT